MSIFKYGQRVKYSQTWLSRPGKYNRGHEPNRRGTIVTKGKRIMAGCERVLWDQTAQPETMARIFLEPYDY